MLWEVLSMSTTNINIKIDTEVKKQFESFCVNTGINMTSAVTSFVKTVIREQRIPFEISSTSHNNFYKVSDDIEYFDEGMVKRLLKAKERFEKGQYQQHELIEG
jgi:DNA-damage-inducible protein J